MHVGLLIKESGHYSKWKVKKAFLSPVFSEILVYLINIILFRSRFGFHPNTGVFSTDVPRPGSTLRLMLPKTSKQQKPVLRPREKVHASKSSRAQCVKQPKKSTI